MVGADRTNKLVADHYIPFHPAVNKGIQTVARAAQAQGIDLSVCGEMAHDPKHIPFLVGMGIKTLSVNPKFLPKVQKTIMSMTMDQARTYAQTLVSQTRIKDAAKILETRPGQ
ncbi:MAG: hypothetical protein HUN05_22870 [Desulfobacter sp.]|nr:MAG: hypothetical protein HUN05_22870 [Desulfobacter sp.]